MWDPRFLNRDPTCIPSIGSIDLTTGLLGKSEIYVYLFVCLTIQWVVKQQLLDKCYLIILPSDFCSNISFFTKHSLIILFNTTQFSSPSSLYYNLVFSKGHITLILAYCLIPHNTLKEYKGICCLNSVLLQNSHNNT